MENMQYSNRIKPQAHRSGTSNKLPQVLPYPQLLDFNSTKSIRDIYSYIIKHYGNSGLSVLIYRQPSKDETVVICGDWNGNNIDLVDNSSKLAEIALKFCQDSLPLFVKTQSLIKIDQAQYFFALNDDKLILVDIQLAYNKFASPGFIRDMFGKVFDTQEVMKTEIIDQRSIEAIKKGSGSYEGDLIIKPSRPRTHHNAIDNSFQQLYVEIKR